MGCVSECVSDALEDDVEWVATHSKNDGELQTKQQNNKHTNTQSQVSQHGKIDSNKHTCTQKVTMTTTCTIGDENAGI